MITLIADYMFSRRTLLVSYHVNVYGTAYLDRCREVTLKSSFGVHMLKSTTRTTICPNRSFNLLGLIF